MKNLRFVHVFSCFIFFLGCLLTYLHQSKYVHCCDATVYLQLGAKYAAFDFLAEPTGTRLYGYPFLSMISSLISSALKIPIHMAVAAFQTLSYFCSVIFLKKLMDIHYGQKAACLISCALLLNVTVYPYLTTPLADGPSVVLLILVATFMVRFIKGLEKPKIAISSAAVLGLVCAFAMMVRPANIHWAWIGIFVSGTVYLKQKNIKLTLLVLLVYSAAFLLVITPQVFQNFLAFNRMTFLPTRDLGGDQLKWGIAFLKYTTEMSPEFQGRGLYYRNPFNNHLNASGYAWYWANPVAGLKTIALHIFGAFDFDFYFPYVYDKNPIYRPLLFVFSQCVLYWSVFGFLKIFNIKKVALTTESRFEHLFGSFSIILFFLSWCSVHGFAAIENRFSLTVQVVLLPLAWVGILALQKNRVSILKGVGLILYFIVAWPISQFIFGLKS